MSPTTWSAGVALIVWLGTLVGLEIGFRRGRRECERQGAHSHEGIGGVEASSFALLGLLLAFSFAAATSRLESKLEITVNEANAISTAFARVDLLPTDRQPAIRALYKEMLETRLRAYSDRRSLAMTNVDNETLARVQQQIWSQTIGAVAGSPPALANLVLSPINEMMDVGTSRAVAFETHLPGLIVGLLIGTAWLSALLVGFAMAKRHSRSLFHAMVYASVLALTVYAVLDLDYPRFGLINIDAAYKPLFNLRVLMK